MPSNGPRSAASGPSGGSPKAAIGRPRRRTCSGDSTATTNAPSRRQACWTSRTCSSKRSNCWRTTPPRPRSSSRARAGSAWTNTRTRTRSRSGCWNCGWVRRGTWPSSATRIRPSTPSLAPRRTSCCASPSTTRAHERLPLPRTTARVRRSWNSPTASWLTGRAARWWPLSRLVRCRPSIVSRPRRRNWAKSRPGSGRWAPPV